MKLGRKRVIVRALAVLVIVLVPVAGTWWYTNRPAPEPPLPVLESYTIVEDTKDLVYQEAMGRIDLEGDVLICRFVIAGEENQLRVVLLNLKSRQTRSLAVPIGRAVIPVAPQTLGVFPTLDVSARGYLLDVATLEVKKGPPIPPGSGFPATSESSQLVGVKRFNDDVWILDIPSGKELLLPASKHGLKEVKLLVGDNRVVLCGWRKDKDGDPYGSLCTQLWAVPSVQIIREYVQEKFYIPPTGYGYVPVQVGNSFCFQVAVGKWRVADLKTGKVRFSVGRAIPSRDWEGYGANLANARVLSSSEDVHETGLLLVEEARPRSGEIVVAAYDVKTGVQVASRSFARDEFGSVVLNKVNSRWFLFIELPKSEDGDVLYTVLRVDDLAAPPVHVRIKDAFNKLFCGNKLIVTKGTKAFVYDLGAVEKLRGDEP